MVQVISWKRALLVDHSAKASPRFRPSERRRWAPRLEAASISAKVTVSPLPAMISAGVSGIFTAQSRMCTIPRPLLVSFGGSKIYNSIACPPDRS
jgi:hypothetical protein